MNIKFFCPRWGSEHMTWNTFAANVKAAGFDGVESPVPVEESQRSEIRDALSKYELLLIGQYYQSFEQYLPDHKVNFRRHLENIITLNPLLIDAQTGKDYFTATQNKELFQIAAEATAASGIVVAHETHRNKALFAAHVARDLLNANPDIRITADFSHWCTVSESLLEQQEDAIQLAVSRTIHIHARVGHAQAPQVSDPRAAEWQPAMQAHLQWWDKIVQHRSVDGAELLTITPEFGPVPYMPALPFSGMPVASQWDINIFMMQLLRDRYCLHARSVI